MKYDLIVSGVGGQGILSISFVVDNAALEDGLRFKQSEVHGMAQRGWDGSGNCELPGPCVCRFLARKDPGGA